MKKKQLLVNFNGDNKEKLRSLAKEKRWSMNAYINWLIEIAGEIQLLERFVKK